MALVVARTTGHVAFSSVLSNTTLSFASLPSAGSLIVVIICGTVDEDGTEYAVLEVTDNQGNTYARRISAPDAGDGNVEIWSAENIGTPSGTFTISINHESGSSENYGVAEAFEISGAAVSAVTEQTTSAGGSSPDDAAFSLTLVQANQIIFAGAINSPGAIFSPPSNYTEEFDVGWQEAISENSYQGSAVYRIVTVGGEHVAQWSHGNADWVVAAASFRASQPTSTVRAAATVVSATRKNAQAVNSVTAAATVSATKRKAAAASSTCSARAAVTSAQFKAVTRTSVATAAAVVTSTDRKASSTASTVRGAAAVSAVAHRNRPSLVAAAAAVTTTTRKNAVRASTVTAGGTVTSSIRKGGQAASVTRAAVAVTSSESRGATGLSVVRAAAAVTSVERKGALGASTLTAAGRVASESRRSRVSAGARVTTATRPGHMSSSAVRAGARVVTDAFRPFAPSVPIDARVVGGPLLAAQVLEASAYCQTPVI